MKKVILTAMTLMVMSGCGESIIVAPEKVMHFDSASKCLNFWKNDFMGSKDPYWNTVDFDETGTPSTKDKFQYPVLKTFYVRGDTKASFVTQSCKTDSTIKQYSYPEFIVNMNKNKG